MVLFFFFNTSRNVKSNLIGCFEKQSMRQLSSDDLKQHPYHKEAELFVWIISHVSHIGCLVNLSVLISHLTLNCLCEQRHFIYTSSQISMGIAVCDRNLIKWVISLQILWIHPPSCHNPSYFSSFVWYL